MSSEANKTTQAADELRPSTFPSGPSPGNEDKDRWPSRTAFYLAAVGSAVGFGNVWRYAITSLYFDKQQDLCRQWPF